MRITFAVIIALSYCCSAAKSHAVVTVFLDRQQWLDAVGHHEFIGFTGYAQHTVITTQYASQGIVFTDTNNTIWNSISFPSDGAGLLSNDFQSAGTIHMAFDGFRTAIGFDIVGLVQIELWSDSQLMYTSQLYVDEFTPFIGFISTIPFDQAIAIDPFDGTVALDNIYFGAPIPAPPVLGLLAMACIMRPSRRRRPA